MYKIHLLYIQTRNSKPFLTIFNFKNDILERQDILYGKTYRQSGKTDDSRDSSIKRVSSGSIRSAVNLLGS